jgi:hypothetical protein
MMLKRISEQEKRPVDFITYIGEEGLNEVAFQYLNNVLKKSSKMMSYIDEQAQIYTCTIGQKFTKANYYVESSDVMSNLKLIKDRGLYV